MKRTTKLLTLFLGIATAAFPQTPLQRAQLDAQRRAADAKANFLRMAELTRQQYATCRAEFYYPGAWPMTCQENLNAAAYYEGMAAAVTDTGDVPEATHRQLNNQRNDANLKTRYLKTAFLAREQYAACRGNPSATALSCQSSLNAANEYEALAATLPQALPK